MHIKIISSKGFPVSWLHLVCTIAPGCILRARAHTHTHTHKQQIYSRACSFDLKLTYLSSRSSAGLRHTVRLTRSGVSHGNPALPYRFPTRHGRLINYSGTLGAAQSLLRRDHRTGGASMTGLSSPCTDDVCQHLAHTITVVGGHTAPILSRDLC